MILGLLDVQEPPSRLFRVRSLADPNEIAAKGIRRIGVFPGHAESIADAVEYAPLEGRLGTTGISFPIGLLDLLLGLLANVSQGGGDDRRVIRTTNVHVRVLGLLFQKVDEGLFEFQQSQTFAGITEGCQECRVDRVGSSRWRFARQNRRSARAGNLFPLQQLLLLVPVAGFG